MVQHQDEGKKFVRENKGAFVSGLNGIPVSFVQYLFHLPGKTYEESFDKVLTQYYTINRFMMAYSNDIILYERYLNDKTEGNWSDYMGNDILVRNLLKDMIQEAQNLPLSDYLLVQSIKNLYDTYSHIIWEPIGQDAEQMEKVYQVSGLIDEKNRELLQNSLNYGFDIYHGVAQDITASRSLSVNLMIGVVVISAVFGSFVNENLLNPIKDLSSAAKKIEEEQFDIPDLPVQALNEVGYLNQA